MLGRGDPLALQRMDTLGELSIRVEDGVTVTDGYSEGESKGMLTQLSCSSLNHSLTPTIDYDDSCCSKDYSDLIIGSAAVIPTISQSQVINIELNPTFNRL